MVKLELKTKSSSGVVSTGDLEHHQIAMEGQIPELVTSIRTCWQVLLLSFISHFKPHS